MNVTRNVEPRDLADRPACVVLALLFWGCTALVVLGPVLLLGALALAWAQPLEALGPMGRAALLQAGLIAALVLPLHRAPGVRRLARCARYALLGPLALLVALTVLVCAGPPL
ncbi:MULTISPECIES: hypothetical protein [Streptomyces]|uniref:hypothetical protein n=1 Tax=Streptomyces TaxID=1883 RepID=UPI0007CD6BB8|nr:hypothetical protein A4V12_21690 [Streptomyces noursei]